MQPLKGEPMHHFRRISAGTRWITLSVLAAFWLLAGPSATAQSGRGALTGTISDPAGAVVPHAAITLTSVETGAIYKTESNAEGIYALPELPSGRYTLKVIAASFREYVQTGIVVLVATRSTDNLVLQLGTQSQTIEVVADAQQLKVDSSDMGTTISPELIEDLPLAVQGQVRSPLQFVQLTPGFSGTTTNSPTSQAGFKLNGGQQGGVDILLDGATIELASPNVQMNYGISVDAVSEFKVMTNTFSAEYGRANGGIVNLVTKSGANRIHGTAYDFLRNKVLDANSWINKHSTTPTARPVDTQNDYGANFSGPVWIPWLYNGHDKTFFMLNYEAYRYNTGSASTYSEPTEAMLGGDFSAIENDVVSSKGITYGGRPIYDYTTCTGTNAGNSCTAFSDNKITYSPDSVFKAAMQYLPYSTGTAPYDNVVVTTQSPLNANLWTIRIDQNLGVRNKFSASYDYDNRTNTTTYSTGSVMTGATNQKTNYLRLGEDFVLTPNILNHVGVGFTRRFRQEFSGEGGLGGDWPSKLGLGGVSGSGFPYFYAINYGDASDLVKFPDNGDNEFADNTYSMSDALSWQHGRHSLKFGVESREQQFNTRWETNTSGQFSFGAGPTSQLDVSNTGFGFASFYLGAATYGYIKLPQGVGMRIHYYAMYGQDDWKISPKLTANLGIRYDLPGRVHEVLDRISFIDPTLANTAAGDLPGAYVYEGHGSGRLGSDSPQTSYMKAVAPRVGLSYQVTPETVLRAGYGIYYSSVKIANYANEDSEGFFGSYTYADAATSQTPVAILSDIQSYPGSTPPFTDPTAMNGESPTFVIDRVARPGTIQNWTVDIERQLGKDWMVDVAYVGAHGDHLQAYMHDPNQGNPSDMARGDCLGVNTDAQSTNSACSGQTAVSAPYSGFSGTVAQALRPFPQYSTANLDTAFFSNPYGVYTFHSLQAQLQKRYSSGLSLLASYTWSKNLTNSDSEYPAQSAWEGNGVSGVLNTYNQRAEKGLSQNDMPHSVILSYTYDLPLGKGKAFLNANQPVVNSLVSGWKISGIHYYQSGTPLNVISPNWDSGIFAGTASSATARPNVVAGERQRGYTGSYHWGDQIFNSSAFTVAPNYTFGDAPRTLSIRELANLDEDFSISKQLPTGTSFVHAVFRVDMFNAFNRHRFTGFNRNVGSSAFGEATTTSGYRTIQGNLRLSF